MYPDYWPFPFAFGSVLVHWVITAALATLW